MDILFQNSNRHYLAKLPFVIYAKPNSNKIIAVLQKDNTLYSLNNNDDKGFVIVSFDGTKKVLLPEEKSDIYFENWEEKSFYYNTENNFDTNVVAKHNFENLVSKALQAIANNELEKVVLSRTETFTVPHVDIELIFNKLMTFYPSAFKYIFYHPQVGFWAAATPEQLLYSNKTALQTVSLAGTQLFSENIVWQQKEINEQNIVTQYITNIIKPFTTTIDINGPYTAQAGQLAHLKTNINANCKEGVSIMKIINLLHPTPAVCGFPKEKALEFIMKNEGYDRSFYAGYIGEWNIDFATFETEKYNLYVNLRCMQIENNEATVYVGCGINQGSNPESEFIETVNKSKTIKKIMV